jgi:hypothetical protein
MFALQNFDKFFNAVGLAYQSPPPLYTSKPNFIFCANEVVGTNNKIIKYKIAFIFFD